MYLGYFTLDLAGEDYGLTGKDLKGLCLGLASRFHVLARHQDAILVVASLKGSEQKLKQSLDEAVAFLETKIGRVEPSEFFVEAIGEEDDSDPSIDFSAF